MPAYKTAYLTKLRMNKTVVEAVPDLIKYPLSHISHLCSKAKEPKVKKAQTSAELLNEIWDNTKYMGVIP